MYSLVSKSLFRDYKEKNKSLVKLVMLLALFASPVALLFAPLPGYLLYTQPVSGIGFWFAVAIFSVLTIFSSYLYDKVHRKPYLLWISHISSYQSLKKHYCKGQMQFTVLSHLLLLAGLTKIDNSFDAILPVAFFISAQLAYFRYRFYRLMMTRRHSLGLSFVQQLTLDLGVRVLPHALLLVGLLVLLSFFAVQVSFSYIALGVVVVLVISCLVLIVTISRVVVSAFSHYRGFILNLSETLYKQFEYSLKALTATLYLSVVGLLCLWLI